MKRLIFAFTLFLSACSTTHKIKTSTSTKIDSVASTVVDTSKVQTVASKTDVLNAKDIDIKINFDDSTKSETVKPFPFTPSTPGKAVDPMSEIIKDAVANSGKAGDISSIEVHIGSLGDSTAQVVSKDSTNVKAVTHTDLKKTIDTKTKDVTRTGMSVWVYVALGVVVLGALVYGAIKIGIKL